MMYLVRISLDKKKKKKKKKKKNLRPAVTAVAVYKPVQKHKVTPGIPGWLNNYDNDTDNDNSSAAGDGGGGGVGVGVQTGAET